MYDAVDSLERASDPGEFVMVALERGKTWLTEALNHGDLDALVTMKGWAATLRTATMQKQLGKDAELAATELVRRAERCIGLGIRQGQAAGEIRVPGAHPFVGNQHVSGPPGNARGTTPVPSVAPTDFASESELSGKGGAGIYGMTDDITDERFDEAVANAKAEGNLSKANLVRKIKGEKPLNDRVRVARELAGTGHTTPQIATRLGYSRDGMQEFLKRHGVEVPADAVMGRTRSLDSTRIVRASVETIDGIGILFPQIVFADLDLEDVKGWLPILDESIRSLTTLRNQLRKASQP